MGGTLMIMDPILTKPYSRFDTFDFASFSGNGIPRHLYLLDDVLQKEGCRRIMTVPAVSFLLNGNIEGNGHFDYVICQALWHLFQKIYRSDLATDALKEILNWLDKKLKQNGLAFSSSLCVYEKIAL